MSATNHSEPTPPTGIIANPDLNKPDLIRARLDELAEESRALRAALRASIALERIRQRGLGQKAVQGGPTSAISA